MKKIVSLLLALICLVALAACATDEPAADGPVTITVDVIGSDGKTTTFNITTEATNLRGALEQENLITGDDSTPGMYYILSVNGETADYAADGAWWNLSKDGVALMTGVDATPIRAGDHFELTYTK